MKKKTVEEVLVRVGTDDAQILTPTDEYPHYAVRIFATVLNGRLEGERLRFYGKWGSEGERRRFKSAAVALGADPDANIPEETTGFGTIGLLTAVVKPNNITGEPEIWFFKPATEPDEEKYY